MKKHYLLSILIFTTTLVFGQWNQNGTSLYYEDGNVGIGLDSPQHLLTLQGNAGYLDGFRRQFLYLNNVNNTDHAHVATLLSAGTDLNNAYGSFGVTAYSYNATPALNGYTYMLSMFRGIAMRAISPSGNIKFITGGNDMQHERMRIDSIGNVGLGNSDPASKLHITDGDVYIDNIEKGIIMKSPDGTCWRGKLNNMGQLNFRAMKVCPEDIVSQEEPMMNQGNVEVTPVPAKENITVRVKQDQSSYYTISIFSSEGRLMKEEISASKLSVIPVKGLSEGMYIVRVYNNNGNLIKSKKIFVVD